MRIAIDGRVIRVAVRDELPVALDPVLVPKPRAAHVGAARPYPQSLVEARGPVVTDADLRRECLDAPVADRLVAARVGGEIRDAGDLEPDDERSVMRDALGVGLGEADADVGRERETLHSSNHYHRRVSVAGLAALVRERQPCVVLTGAGVSTESGIPDFRSSAGIWADVDPFEVASIQAFRRDPERVWDFYRRRIHLLLDAEPNVAHRALAELERRGFVSAIVTQNIDTLHSRAGSRTVIEVHGSIRFAQCLDCLWAESTEAVLAQLEERSTPLCPHCHAVLKPGVTLFGELLPPGTLERATELARTAALLLVVGSSLEVWPVAGLPLEARSFAIVNRGPTALDDRAALKVDAVAGEALGALVDHLSQSTGRHRVSPHEGRPGT